MELDKDRDPSLTGYEGHWPVEYDSPGTISDVASTKLLVCIRLASPEMPDMPGKYLQTHST